MPREDGAAPLPRAGGPRTSLTIGTVDVHVAAPPPPAAPPQREPVRAAAPQRNALEARFLDRFLLGG